MKSRQGKVLITSSIFLSVLMSQPILAKDLATIDDMTISVESVTAALKALGPQGEMVAASPELKKKFIDHMVNSSLVAKKARSEGFDRNSQFQSRLADVTNQLLAGEYMDFVVAKKMTEKNLRAWFEENKSRFSKKEVHALHILCDDESTAKAALSEAKASPDKFLKIAKKYSKDKTVDLGFFGAGRMVPEFEKAAFSTSPGVIHASPVKTQFGWHIIKVIAARGEKIASLEKSRPEVEKRYRQKIQEDLIHDLRKQSKIAVNEQSIKDIKLP